MNNNLSLKEAVKFHGHLGPYLVLGILAGELALDKLKCSKYFGLGVDVAGVNKKPKSCFIDGLQLSTGATYGKGNIKKIKGKEIIVICRNLNNHKKIRIFLKKDLLKKLDNLNGHKDCEDFAKHLLKIEPQNLFIFK